MSQTPHPEFLDIPPLWSVGGTVSLPGSKSISNRVLLLAALADGCTEIHDLLDSDDTRVMLEALKTLGCQIRREGQRCWIQGLSGQLPVKSADLYLGNAGTAMRPLTAALAILATVQGGRFHLHGLPRMHERPIGDLLDALRAMGCEIQCTQQEGYPPLQLGTGEPGRIRLDAPILVKGQVSSQFLTALLLSLPLCTGQQRAIVEVDGPLISRPYIEITLAMLRRFGVDVQTDDKGRRFTVPAGSRLKAPDRPLPVEGDASSASYFIAAAALAATGNPLRIQGLGMDALQGDIRFVEAAAAMGAKIEGGTNHLLVSRGDWPLQAVDIDCNHIPDAAMTLAVMALFAKGTTTLRNIASWRVKETDRLSAMSHELRKLGAHVVEQVDAIEITPPECIQRASIATYDDHRMAMCFSLAAFNGLRQPMAASIRIEDPHCTAKTFPAYFETLFSVATADRQDIPVITIDGPAASGKGTLASQVADRLGYHFLDSGVLYRATGWAAEQAGLNLDDEAAVAQVAARLPIRFEGDTVWLGDQDVSQAVRSEAAGIAASRVSFHPAVRAALLELQQSFRRLPGLVADGRDMGTAIFPDAPLKVFLTASAAKRAERRYKQLISKGISANIDSLARDLEDRDARDMQRASSPLKPAQDALRLDNSELGIEDSVQWVMKAWQRRVWP